MWKVGRREERLSKDPHGQMQKLKKRDWQYHRRVRRRVHVMKDRKDSLGHSCQDIDYLSVEIEEQVGDMIHQPHHSPSHRTRYSFRVENYLPSPWRVQRT